MFTAGPALSMTPLGEWRLGIERIKCTTFDEEWWIMRALRRLYFSKTLLKLVGSQNSVDSAEKADLFLIIIGRIVQYHVI